MSPRMAPESRERLHFVSSSYGSRSRPRPLPPVPMDTQRDEQDAVSCFLTNYDRLWRRDVAILAFGRSCLVLGNARPASIQAVHSRFPSASAMLDIQHRYRQSQGRLLWSLASISCTIVYVVWHTSSGNRYCGRRGPCVSDTSASS